MSRVETTFDPATYMLHVIRGLVDDPDQVSAKHSGGCVSVLVAPTDVGKVIGTNGRTARALRLILNAAAATTGCSLTLDLRGDLVSVPSAAKANQ